MAKILPSPIFLKIAGDLDIDMLNRYGTSEINKINVRPKKTHLTSGST